MVTTDEDPDWTPAEHIDWLMSMIRIADKRVTAARKELADAELARTLWRAEVQDVTADADEQEQGDWNAA